MNNRTKTNNTVITIGGRKNDGKSTIANYFMEWFNQPTLIIDVAKQYTNNTPYRIIINGLKELRLYCLNSAYRDGFYKGKLQLIFRTSKEDYEDEISQAMKLVNEHLHNICIVFEEMELYADRWLTKKSPIYKTLYLSRNNNFNIICIIKEIGDLSKLVKSATDVFFLGQIKDHNAITYFNNRGGKYENSNTYIFSDKLKKLKFREFLVTDFTTLWNSFKLKQKILTIIK